ncbi:hybrid sensor histidine kinase/response regulator transcription factor [Pseudozobellia sp. WGM2]|uniref:hybrid sensor histidine kinase/response regulator n=1 Tax=Pseudozobellia sp. WGM2 TaxID=2787625 RepID=UPI001ADF642E|nr:hybrid sensor histidine kinase/response regulator transcription factor [Pseudozobellia sp. WGM2]
MKFLLLFFLLQVTNLCGQDFYFKHYKVEDGLSHNTVQSSMQDEKGFLWFGTKNGLNRYDGYNFRLFQNNPDDPKSLGSNYVESLYEIKGKIWAGTDNGLFAFNEQLENFDIVEGTENTQILDMTSDSSGLLWFIADGSVVKYDYLNHINKVFSASDFFYATDVLNTTNGIWACSTNTLYRYRDEDESFDEFKLGVSASPESPFGINELYLLDDRTLLLGTQNHGVLAFDIITNRLKEIEFLTAGNQYVRDFALNGDNELWVATESGLHIYNLITKRYDNLTKNHDNPYALSDNAVYTLTVDREGGVWAGTYFGGINYRAKQDSPFKKFFPMSSQNSLNGNALREICEDKYGNLWIGTEDGGLNKYNPTTGVFTNYTSREKDSAGNLAHYNIHGLLPIEEQLWIGMFDSGLDVLDIKTGRLKKHYGREKEDGLRSNFIFSIDPDESGNIFFLTTYGVQTFNTKTEKFELYEGLPHDLSYRCFLADNEGVLWAGTSFDGLYSYNPITQDKNAYQYDTSDPKSISNNHINSVFQDSKNNIWVCTENGLNLYNTEKKGFTKYGIKDGFPTNVFYSILEDNNGQLWISTSNGLIEYNPISGIKKVYTKADGLQSEQFNYKSAYKASDGTMYFGSVNGMISFNPEDFKKNTFSAPIYITGLQINNENVFVGQENSPIQESTISLDEITLKPSQSSFSLEFAALSYTAPENTEYWYKMEGLNENWVHLQKDHKVYFTELAAGNYNFILKSMNSSGVLGMETDGLKIEVLPPFYRSNLAYFLYFLCTILIIFLAFREYHRRIRFKNERKIKLLNNRKEKEIYEAKIEFFTNISHEIRTPLTLIKSPLEKTLQTTQQSSGSHDNLMIVKRNVNRLLDLVNQLLDFRKTEIERVNLTFVKTNITKLVQTTYERFSEAIRDKEVDFRLALGDADIYASVDPEAFKKILSNLYGNAVKYADNTVLVDLGCDEETIRLHIKNDGELIPNHLKEKIFEPFYRISDSSNQTGTGIGLALARSLSEMHQGSLTIDTSDGNMNSFVLTVPVHQEKEFMLRPEKVEDNHIDESIDNQPAAQSNENIILLVEDSIELLDFVSKELREDYYVLKATDGEKALKLLQEENVQLVISDVMMPGMNGFELCRKIKTNLETSHVPVIMLTSKNAMSSKMEGLESGADAYIEKPFSVKHLKIHVANLIENRRHVMEHYASSPLAHIRSIANTKTDDTFIKKLDEVIMTNMADPDLNVETLAEIMHMSRSTLYRKIKDISNLSPNELINIARLKRSAELLKTGNYRVFEVAEIVGYNSPTSFGRNFQKQFEMSPTEYMNNKPK